MDISYIEKNAGPIANAVIKGFKSHLGSTERYLGNSQVGSLARDNINSQIGSNIGNKTISEFDRSKYAKLQARPKVITSGLKRAKDFTIGEGANPSLSMAIKNSKNSSKVLSRNKGITEPIYAGGNTAANIRGVIRSENKMFNKNIKKRYGRTAQGFVSRSKRTY